jgi:hypothetical protein
MTASGARNRRLVKLKRKSLFGLLAMGLLVAVPILSACSVATTELGDGVWETPHVFTGGFENCFICHTGGRSATPVATHRDFTLEKCSEPLCHPLTAEVAASLAALENAE